MSWRSKYEQRASAEAALLIRERDVPETRDANMRTFDDEHRRTVIVRLYLSHQTIDAIAAKIRLPEQTEESARHFVRTAIRRVREEWKKERIRDWTEERERHLARIDALEATYWDAWYRSLDPDERTKTEVRDSPRGTIRIGQSLKHERPIGNMDALQGIERCLQERARILGLYAPTKIAPTNPSGDAPYDPISDETRVALAAAAFLASGKSTPAPGQPDDAPATGIIPGVARPIGADHS